MFWLEENKPQVDGKQKNNALSDGLQPFLASPLPRPLFSSEAMLVVRRLLRSRGRGLLPPSPHKRPPLSRSGRRKVPESMVTVPASSLFQRA